MEPSTWSRLSSELGLTTMLLPEAYGGGFSLVEFVVVMEEAGAALLGAPLFATAALAVPLLVELQDDAALERYAPGIADGTLTATVALREGDGPASPLEPATTATRDADGWRITGTKTHVVDGASAGLILLTATSPDGPGVFAVEAGASGVEVEPLVTLDQTRKLANLTFDSAPAIRVGPTDASRACTRARLVSTTLLAAEQVGGAQRCLDVTAEYARSRIQFARPIGSFQAVKQRLAEMLIQVESARSAVVAAAQAAVTDDPEFPMIASIAALTAMEAFGWVSAQMIQLHGGIGFTWEHDAHLYFKRARTGAQLLGTASGHISAIAERLDDLVPSADAPKEGVRHA